MCHVSFRTLGQGWVNPSVEFDKFIGELGLQKPGITWTMPPSYLHASMGVALNALGSMTKEPWKSLANVISFDDPKCQNECSTALGNKLVFDGDVFFEAGNFAHILDAGQQLGIHCDFLNDGTSAYDKISVFSVVTPKQNGDGSERVISGTGYARQCC